MTRLADPLYLDGASSKGRVAQFSPNGKYFLVLLTRGNVERNTNEGYLLLYKTSQAFHSPKPDTLLTMSSSSNRQAIKEIKWLDDNETVTFLGEEPGQLSQVYRFNIRSKHLESITQYPTTLFNYDISADGGEVVFVADPPVTKMDTEKARREGIVVSTQTLDAILAGDCAKPDAIERKQLFVKVGNKPPFMVPTSDFVEEISPISLSPDGRYLVFLAWVRHAPPLWDRYQNASMHQLMAAARQTHAPDYSGTLVYMLFDISEHTLTTVLDAPRDTRMPVTWSPDGSSVVIPTAYLPLDVNDIAEEEAREKNTYTVEVKLPNKKIVKIRQDTGHLYTAQWEGLKRITLSPLVEDGSSPASYERDGSGWKERATGDDTGEAPVKPIVTLEEDPNNSPKVYLSDMHGERKGLLLDLNPQFKGLRFGRVETVTWMATDGSEWQGSLFFPPAYVPGKHYPLIIQTHGFDPTRFYIDGPWSVGFAAQPFAAKEFVVLQIGIRKSFKGAYTGNSPQEASAQMAAYIGGIDYLDARGVIDKNRVGIIGFSRTTWHVGYALTHSNSFRAATLVDGIDAGYFSYLAVRHLQVGYDQLNGGAPYGEGMTGWLKNSPGFNLDKVQAPVRLEPHGPGSLLLQWEWFSGLSYLQRPVELVYLPEADHITVKPWERMVSQQGNVDWFAFWLKGDEDPDPSKADQYARWRELRNLQQQQRPADTSATRR